MFNDDIFDKMYRSTPVDADIVWDYEYPDGGYLELVEYPEAYIFKEYDDNEDVVWNDIYFKREWTLDDVIANIQEEWGLA